MRLTCTFFVTVRGKFEYKFPVTSTFTSGTYAAIAKTSNNNSEATIFGIGSAPTDKIVILLDQLNFQHDKLFFSNLMKNYDPKQILTQHKYL